MNTKGLTVIELLLVIGLFTIVGTTASPVLSNFLVRNYVYNKTNEIVSLLRTAQLNSMAGKTASRWGVNISATKLTLFKGSSYATRNTAFDKNFDIPSSITITTTEVVFNPVNGNPTATPTITISNNYGVSRTVTVNSVGTVDVN